MEERLHRRSPRSCERGRGDGQQRQVFHPELADEAAASRSSRRAGHSGAFADHPATLGARAAENYRNARERGDKRLVLDHALSDAAAELTDAVRSALDSYDGLRNNGNTSNTALQQAAVAGQVTEGQLIAAMAQLMAYQAAREAAEDYEKEIRAAGAAGPVEGLAGASQPGPPGAPRGHRGERRQLARWAGLQDPSLLRRIRKLVR